MIIVNVVSSRRREENSPSLDYLDSGVLHDLSDHALDRDEHDRQTGEQIPFDRPVETRDETTSLSGVLDLGDARALAAHLRCGDALAGQCHISPGETMEEISPGQIHDDQIVPLSLHDDSHLTFAGSDEYRRIPSLGLRE